MTRKPIQVRYVHAGDLTTNQAHTLTWTEGTIDCRYQEIAIVGDQVIGSWQYEIQWWRGRAIIDSSHTGVATRFRRRGIAIALWMHGIARWKPDTIKALIGTNEGRYFLARMKAQLSYVSPDTFLNVRLREGEGGDAACWDSLCEMETCDLLRKLGREQIAAKVNVQKKLPKPKLEVAA